MALSALWAGRATHVRKPHYPGSLAGLAYDASGCTCGRGRPRLRKNLFLRKQLALYHERQVKSRRASAATRIVLVLLARMFAWRDALLIVQPATLSSVKTPSYRLFVLQVSSGALQPF